MIHAQVAVESARMDETAPEEGCTEGRVSGLAAMKGRCEEADARRVAGPG